MRRVRGMLEECATIQDLKIVMSPSGASRLQSMRARYARYGGGWPQQIYTSGFHWAKAGNTPLLNCVLLN